MRTLTGLGVASLLTSFALMAGCGESSPESMVEGGAAQSNDPNSGKGGGLILPGVGGGSSGSSSSGGGDQASGGNKQGCAAVNEQAELSPVYLVFLLDESGSMGDGENGIKAQKWDPVVSALKSFFADPASTGITASLSVFPNNKNKTKTAANRQMAPDCNSAAYETPIVTPTALPDATTFAAAITGLEPPNEFGTPTSPGLSGTIAYAESVLQEDPARRVAIVMVTDGQPYGCGNSNSVDNTAAAAAAVADHIPTYVIGVEDERNTLADLHKIAVGGGTETAFIVNVAEPEQTRTSLLEAINLIRGQAISCDLEIPPTPPGKTFVDDEVDVQFTPDGGAAVKLAYGTDCTGDAGWHYDNLDDPKRILLCDSACSTVKADPKGKLDVVFICDKRQVVQ